MACIDSGVFVGFAGPRVRVVTRGGEATVRERSMKPCNRMQKRAVEKIKADEAAGGR